MQPYIIPSNSNTDFMIVSQSTIRNGFYKQTTILVHIYAIFFFFPLQVASSLIIFSCNESKVKAFF